MGVAVLGFTFVQPNLPGLRGKSIDQGFPRGMNPGKDAGVAVLGFTFVLPNLYGNTYNDVERPAIAPQGTGIPA